MGAGDVELAAGLIRAAELHAPDAQDIISGDDVGRIWLYRGMIVYQQGSHEDLAMDVWRQALTVDDQLQWDASAMDDNAAHGLFEALRQEVRSKPEQSVQHPGATGVATLYVDGRRVREGDVVLQGVHLAQVKCPDAQGIHGLWTDFGRRLKWLELCPDGVDTTVAAVEEEDEFEGLGPVFGSTAPQAQAQALVLAPAPLEPQRRKISTPLLVGAGSAALISGGVYLAALNSRSDFDDLSSTSMQSAEDVAALRSQTNNRVYLSVGSGVLAVGLYTAAFIQF
jgi:hypothetical protein